MSKKYTAVLMASGFSARMGTNKLLLPVNGKPMILHVIEEIQKCAFYRVILVTAYEEVGMMAEKLGCEVVMNQEPEMGQSRSVVLGVQESMDADGWMFFSGDMPYLRSETILSLLKASESASDRIIVPLYCGKRGQPVLFPQKMRDQLLKIEGDEGGRSILRSYPEEIFYVHFDFDKDAEDIDTPEKYKQAVNKTDD